MVSHHEKGVVILPAGIHHAAQVQVDGLNTDDRSLVVAGVAHHVSVRVIAPDELIPAGLNSGNDLLRHLRCLHPRLLVKRDDIGRNLFPVLELLGEFLGTVSVPEIRHMTELLRLGAGIGFHAFIHQELGQRMLDVRRLHKEVCRKL